MSDPYRAEEDGRLVISDDMGWPGKWLNVATECRSCGHRQQVVVPLLKGLGTVPCAACGRETMSSVPGASAEDN